MRLAHEKSETLKKQVKALSAGTNPVVYFPKGTRDIPSLPRWCRKARVNGENDGAGTYFYREGVSESEVRSAAREGRHGHLLGFVQSKSEVAQGIPIAVVARDAKGTELKTAAVDGLFPEIVLGQMVILQEQFPEAKIDIESLPKVAMERLR